MTITLKGIQIELPEGALVEISDDGMKVKVSGVPTTEPEVIEKIRVVEVEVPYETIRFIPQSSPIIITNPTPWTPWQQPYTGTGTWPTWPTSPTWTSTGTVTVDGSGQIWSTTLGTAGTIGISNTN